MRCSLVLILLALSVSSDAHAQAQTAQPKLEVVDSRPVTFGQRVEMRSEILDTTVSMNIYLPESYDISSSDHTYPLIFSNGGHGEEFFETLAGIVKHLGDRERIPELIVVSLNDMGDIPEVYTHGMWDREKIGGSGDAKASIRHLQEEVIPYLETHYRANQYRLIIGVSGSCLFPIYTFTAAPDLFQSHILIAAADMVGMGYQPDETFIDAFEKALAAAPKRQAKLYVGVADSDVAKRADYQVNLDALTARFAGSDQLDLRVDVVENADHYAVFIKAMLSALEQNFPHDRWSSRYRDLVAQPGDALANIDRYYQELSKHYGFRILPRADRWNNVNSLRFMIRHLSKEGRTQEAVAVAKRRIEYRPGSAYAFAGLADAYEADGQIKAALAAQEKALNLARKASADDPSRVKRYEEQLASLREKARQQAVP